MGKLIYAITTSLDGYVSDKNGNFEWAEPSEEVHMFFNDLVRGNGTSLLGCTMYEVMSAWDEIPTEGVSGPYMDGPSAAMNDYAQIWRDTNKIVYSTTLLEVTSPDTTIKRAFDTNEVRKMVDDSEKNFDIGGPHLAAAAVRANIIDEYHQLIAPVIVGGGTHWLPDNADVQLDFVDSHTFENGFVHIHYRRSDH